MAVFSLDRRILQPAMKPWGYADAWTSGAGWLPTELASLVLWLDADDANTITLDGSNNVEQWDDKSGNNNNVSQSSSSLRPACEEISGMNFVKFNGASDVLRRNLGAILSGDDPITVFCVVRVYGYGGDVGGGVVWGLGGDGTVARDTAFFCMETSSGTWIRLLGGNAQWEGTPLNTSKMFSLIYPGGGVVWRCYSEGAELTAISSVTGTHNWETNIDLSIGGAIPSRSDDSLNGSIGEVLIYTQSMSQIDRQKIEGYLAHKWGLTANLPSGHPYKSEAP